MPGTIVSRPAARHTTSHLRCRSIEAGSDVGSSWLGVPMTYSPESIGEYPRSNNAHSLSPLLIDNPLLCNFGDEPGTVYYDTRKPAGQAWKHPPPPPLADQHLVPARTWYDVGPDYGTVYYDSRESTQFSPNVQKPVGALGLTGVQAPLPSFSTCYGPARGTVYYDSRVSLLQRASEKDRSLPFATPRTPSKSFSRGYGHTPGTVYYDSKVSLPQRMLEAYYTPDPDTASTTMFGSPLATHSFTPGYNTPKREVCSLNNSPTRKIQKPRFHLTN